MKKTTVFSVFSPSAILSDDIYLKNWIVSLASAKRFNDPKMEYVLFLPETDSTVRQFFEGHKHLFGDMSITLQAIPFTYAPPNIDQTILGNAYFKLDAWKHAGKREGSCIYVDLDCVFINSIAPIVDHLQRHDRPLLLRVSDTYFEENLQKAYHSMFGSPMEVLHFFGGEFLAVSASNLRLLSHMADSVFRDLTSGAIVPGKVGKYQFFDNEEFLSNYILNKIQYDYANTFVSRVVSWENSTAGPDNQIWHLQGEKSRGLLRIYQDVINQSSPFWETSPDRFARYICEVCTMR